VPASTQASPSLSLTDFNDFHVRPLLLTSSFYIADGTEWLYSMPHTQIRTPRCLSSTAMAAVGTCSDTSVNGAGPRVGWPTRIAARYAGQSGIGRVRKLDRRREVEGQR